MAYEEIRVTRRDMARAEIHSGIGCLVAGDYVSAHVLAFSAKAILRGVAKARGINTIDDEFELYIKEEHIPDWRKAITEAYNVFKHANDDPDRELDKFRPETTAIALFTATINYGLVYRQASLSMTLFRSWYFCRHPDWAKPPFNETVEEWKAGFNNPADKPLQEAVSGLREMLGLLKQYPDMLFARIPAEAQKHVER